MDYFRKAFIICYLIISEYLYTIHGKGGGRGGGFGRVISNMFGGKGSGRSKKSTTGTGGGVWYTSGGGPSVQLIFLIIIIVIFGVAALLVILKFLANHFCRAIDGDSVYSEETLESQNDLKKTNSKHISKKKKKELSETPLLSKHLDIVETSFEQPNGTCTYSNSSLSGRLNNDTIRRQPSAPEESLLLQDMYEQKLLSSGTNLVSGVFRGSHSSCSYSFQDQQSSCTHSLNEQQMLLLSSMQSSISLPTRVPLHRQISVPGAYLPVNEGRSGEMRQLSCVPEVDTSIHPNECPPSYMDSVKRTRSYSI